METKKITIKILDYKDTSANRTTFETNLGKMSAFKNEGSTLIQDLKDHTNCLISVGMSESVKDGTTYRNIRDFYGKIVEQAQPVKEGIEVISPQKFTRPEPTDNPEELFVASQFIERDKDASFYTAYAKDICIALIERCPPEKKLESQWRMKTAIELIEQAREAFSA